MIGLLTGCVLAANFSFAAPPDIEFLFPSGLQQGTTRTLKVEGKPGTAPLQAWCDDEGLHVAPHEKGENLTVSAEMDVSPGLHWVRLFNDEGASSLLPLIVGVIPEITEADFDSDAPDQDVALPVTISGVLSRSGQVDEYPISLEHGQTLIASVDAHRSLGAPADMVLQLVSEAGFVIEQNDDFHGFDPQIVSTATQAGNYSVRLFAFPAEPNSTIRFAGGDEYVYRLTLTTGPFVDHLVPLSLPTDDSIDLRFVGWNIPEQQQHTRWPLASSSPVSLIPFPASIDRIRTPLSPLSIALEATPPNSETLQTLSLGTIVTGHIDKPADVDVYAFDAAKDQRLQMTVAARACGSPLDPVLRVLDSHGKLIEEDDDISRENVDVQMSVRIPADDTYRAELTDRFGHGGLRYVYELRIEPQRPSFTLSVKADRYVIKDRKPVEVPVSIDRDRGFDDEITVTARGLPEGVSAEPAVSGPKGDSSKEITLKLAADAAVGFNGPIEIIGSSPDRAEVVATTPTPCSSVTTTRIWLTVPPAPDKVADAPSTSPAP